MPNLNTLGFQQWKFKHFKIYRIGAWPPAGGSKGTKICKGIVEAPSSDLVFFSVGKEAYFFFIKFLFYFPLGGACERESLLGHIMDLYCLSLEGKYLSRLLPVPAWSLDSEGLHSGWKTGVLEPYACVHVCVCSCACVRVCVHTCIYTHMRYLALWHTRHPFVLRAILPAHN